MSDKSGGFFSSMGRFFSGGNKSKDSEKSPTSSPSPFDPPSDDVAAPVTSSVTRSSASSGATAFLKDIVSADKISDLAGTSRSRLGSSLRYLSPSALDRHTDGLEIDVDQASDIFDTPTVSTSRKRQLTELDRQLLPQSFRSDSVKRSRFLNRSLLEPTLRSSLNVKDRLDATWCGELTGNHSPASSITNFSLLSRRSGGTTNGSLSSRTQKIFKKLEEASTPAKDIQRMTMLRSGLTRPERWEGLSDTTATPPPLKKAGDSIPSRIQLISKYIPPKKTPYWKDLTRKRTESKNGDNGSSDTHSLQSLNGNFAATELSSLFSMEPPAPKKSTTESSSSTNASKKQHSSVIKGSDGKQVSRNTFRLLSDEVDEDDLNKLPPLPVSTLSNPKPLVLSTGSAPKPGFLDNLSFTFRPPTEVTSTVSSERKSSVVSTSESKEIDSDSTDGVAKDTEKSSGSSTSSSESDGESSEESVADGDEEEEEVPKESRPHTSADTISSASVSNQSSKDSSPKTLKPDETVPPPKPPVAASGANWDCTECFCSWPDSKKECGACGVPRGGPAAPAAAPAQKQLVSNLASFAPKANTTGVSFGFGTGAAPAAPVAAPVAAPAAASKPPAFGFGTSSTLPSSTPSLFGTTKSTTPAVTTAAPTPAAPVAPAASAAPAAAADPSRVDWFCQDCFASNKAKDDKCPCCGYVKYSSADSTSSDVSSNVFGARAFKPTTAAPSGGADGAPISFGFGLSAAAPAAAPVAFGVSAAAPPVVPVATVAPVIDPVTAPVAAPAAPTPAPLKAPEPAKPSLFGGFSAKPATGTLTAPAASSTVPLFGSSSGTSTAPSLFGTAKLAAPAVAPAASTEAPKPSLFGGLPSSAPAPTASAAAPTIAPATTSLFGNATTTSTSNPFGSSTSLFAPKPAVAPTLSFGGSSASSTTSEAPKPSLFGNLTTPAAPTTTAAPPAPTTSASLFGAFSSKPADSTTSGTTNMFGKPFGGDVGTTTTDGGVPAKRGMFSSDAPKLSFGGEVKTNPPAFGGFGASKPATTLGGTSSLFGASSSSTTPAAAPTSSLFGGSSSQPLTVPSFGSSFGGASTATSAPAPFSFGSNQPTMSASSSTNSLFGGAAADSSNPFGTTSTNGFNFGGNNASTTSSTTANAGGIFQFGSSAQSAPAPTAPPTGAFQFGGNSGAAPAAPGMDNAFSYQAPTGTGGARKMAMARRRNLQRK